MDPQTLAYLHHYQRGGGQHDYFRGLDEQYAEGIGDFFGKLARGLWTFLGPAVGSAAASAVSNAAQNISEGKSLKETVRSSLGTAAGTAVRGVGDAIQRRIQTGHGRRRRRKGHKARSGPKRRRTHKKLVGGGKRRGRVGKRRVGHVYKKRRGPHKHFPLANF